MRYWSEPCSTDSSCPQHCGISICVMLAESVLRGSLHFRTLKVRILKVLILCQSAKVKQRYHNQVSKTWASGFRSEMEASWARVFFYLLPKWSILQMLLHFGKVIKYAKKISKKWRKAYFQLALNLFFGWFLIPKNLISSTRSITSGGGMLI